MDHPKTLRLGRLVLWATWLLSIPGLVLGPYVLAFWQWESGKHFSWTTHEGHTGFGLFVWTFVIGGLAWITILPATCCMFFLWGFKRVSAREKISATVAVALSWLGLWAPRILN